MSFIVRMKASWIFVLTWGAATANVAHRLLIIFTKFWLQMSAVLRFKWQMPSFIPSMSSFGRVEVKKKIKKKMDVDKEVQHLEDFMKDSQANLSEIIRIYYCIAKDASSAASSAVPILNKLAVDLLSPEVTSILKKHRLDAFSYILVANNLLDLDDVKDDLENGDVLITNAPANAIRRLKEKLGVTSAVAIPTAAPVTQTAAQALSAPLDKLQITMRSSSSVDQAASHRDDNRVAVEIKNQCTDMRNLNGMILYKLPLRATSPFSGAASIVRRFSFGEPSALTNKTCKTILLMGATGSGKTTMIHAMINYVLGVRWDDPFRFILIDEDVTSQAFSQTRKVTAYDIHYRNGFRIPYSLTIVDTPGFGDTEGIEHDHEITLAVKQLFENRDGIQELDAVCFTVQSSLPRLTSSQTYIFHSVLSLFGKDIGENVRFLLTFADGGRPSVLAAIKEAMLPCLMDANKDPCHQSFNNRAVFVSNQTPGDLLSPIEWDNAMQNFHSFFAELSKMPIKSLQLTKEVLNSRESLHITIQGLEATIQAHLMKMEELREIEEIDSQANTSEIIRIYYCIAKDASSAASSAVPILNKLAVHLLSPAVTSILKKHRLDAFSYMLVANNLLDVDDVKDELENGDALRSSVPPNAIRKLKAELGVVSVFPPATPAAECAPPTPSGNPQGSMSSRNYLDHKTASTTDENRLPIEIRNQCIYIKKVNGMDLYVLPLNRSSTFSGASSIVRRFSFGEPDPSGSKTCKTILLMGATGSGKTTMINAMINYVLGVRWDDPFRFILIDKDVTSEAFSQTREVTAYDIHYRNGFRVPYSLTIVDTPGFGDTEGIERDQEITSAVKQFFENRDGIQELDVVGFTVQSSLPRLTNSQTYIFNSVLSIFGKDIGENVRFLVTFADGRQPPVLAAIKIANLPCQMDDKGEPCHQSFNNGVVYASNQVPGDRLSPIEWDNAMQNFRSFFVELSKMPIKSLQLTKKVLNSRESLHITIQGLEATIQAHLMKMEELQKIEEIIALNKEHVNANKNFEITVKEPKKKRIEVEANTTAMNCSKCEVTCHYPCYQTWVIGFCHAFRRSETFLSLLGLSSGHGCKVCPGKCATTDHANELTKWIYVQEEETRTLYDIRKKYDDAMAKTLSAEELKNALQGEAEQLKFVIIKAMDEITRCANLLKKIALRGDPLSTPEYINLMIENEIKEKKPGYLERIKSFKDLLKKAELTKDVTDGGDLAKKFKK